MREPAAPFAVLVECYLFKQRTIHLCDVLMKRVEQGVPLEMLDMRACHLDLDCPAAVRLLSEIVDVLGPEETVNARPQIISTRDGLTCRPFVGHEPCVNFDESDTDDE